MLYGLLIAFVPLFLGYIFQVKQTTMLWVNRIAISCLYLILLTMGISLGQLDELETILPKIGTIALGLSVIIHSCNILALILFDKFFPSRYQTLATDERPSRKHLLIDSLLLCSMVLIGGVIGFIAKTRFHFPLNASTYVLVVMIFCVGIQLRNSNIPLRQVFLNRQGIYTSIIFILSGLLGGVIAAYFLNLSIVQGLAFASGFGWYSLSSVLINDAWGAAYGSIAFFNDLSREIFCLFAIPFFMRNFPSTAVGLGGATSLDATLPIIQKSGGIQVVPLAISFGFIINLAVPLLLPFFLGLG
ncbi:uncharacterized membrane protein YbjE (DUF340 family) [Nicoletella semolina]|uniref:Uncharacterized membrane protein YbjE (DUF340 family) n=1 Tax=Nicoletella semolina TaxID=271160 RepID=A0A4R2NCT8_9PAST|nr:lysine exporter LysO family protein [Nicoletella semolina]MDH2924219.1 hypothetical protein [Nicoletella semolina]TCP18884.1 uncharacterized membrane protein YbjE (DUF340 family) [Nicoletella semolina]